MPVLTTDQQNAVLAEAARAPSVHNVQPARWRFDSDGIVLLRMPGRVLPVGDPTGHDVEASLGAAWEGMSIALSRIGYSLGPPIPCDGGTPGAGAERRGDAVRGDVVMAGAGSVGRLPGGGAPPRPIRCAAVTPHAGALDTLAAHVGSRRSHRGRFLPRTADARLRLRTISAADAFVVDEPAAIADVALMHDRATWHFESNAAYHAELWTWLRMSPSHPDWGRDGLNADCLALSRAERIGARFALQPRAFAVLSRLGVARALVSEAASVRSAAGIVLFAPSRALAPFDVGRRFYRLWLQIAAAGLHAAPMSATSDFTETRDALARRHGIPDDRRLANVLRVGLADGVAKSPRLPVDELRG